MQLWIRENDIRGKYDKETAAQKIKEKRAELTLQEGKELGEVDDRGGKRRRDSGRDDRDDRRDRN